MTDFKVGVVRPDDIVLTFPAGTKVVDAIENVAFIVQPDGTRKPVPLREPRPAR